MTVPRRDFLEKRPLLAVGLDSGPEAAGFPLGVSLMLGEEGRRREGSTGGSGVFGLGEKWLAWAAISRAIPSVESNRLWPEEELEGVGGRKSANGPWVPRRLPGVELKTE